MAKTKISEFSSTPGNNTDIDGINIAEGCAPSGINDAIRELMAQLKDFQAGDAGDSITVVGTLAAKGTSSAAADLKLYEDTDNGTNYVGFIAPTSIASNVQWTLPSADGSSGQALQTNGSGTLSFATLGISAGGTGQTTANAAFNALAPSQTSNAGRYLKTDGTNTSWDLLDISTADITGTLPVANGGTGLTSFTANGVLYASSSSALTTGSALTFDGTYFTANGLRLAGADVTNTIYQATGSLGISTGSATGITFATNLTTRYSIDATGVAVWSVGGSEQMRLTSTGLGIGTSSLDSRLEINSSASNTARIRIKLNDTPFCYFGGYSGIVGSGNADDLALFAWTGKQLMFGTNATEKMRLDTAGNLGLGTSSPSYKLDVQASTAVTQTKSTTGTNAAYYVVNNTGGDFYIGRENSAGTTFGTTAYSSVLWAAGAYPMSFFTNGTERMRLDSSGNLGLGVTPSAWASSFKVIQLANGTSLSNNGQTSYYQIGANNYYDGSNYKYIASNYAGFHRFSNAGAYEWHTAPSGTAGNAISFTQAMTLDASGNLGVGTTTPASFGKFAVRGAVNLATWGDTSGHFSDATTGSLYITHSSNKVALKTDADLELFCNNTGDSIIFSTNAAERARITSGGNLLVGKTSSDLGTAGIEIFGAGYGQFTANNDASLFSNRLGSDGDTVKFYRATSLVGSISVTTSATAYNTSSDYRLKDNPQPLTGSGAFIDSLKPKTWNWKTDGSKGVGFIAHEVQEVSPNSVVGEKDGEQMQAMEYGSAEFIANIIAELQSLRARVAQLEAK